jgi:hypothetical protein
MDRLRDRLAALAEEVGEFAQPPGVAVTARRARRRRQRAVGLVAVGLLTVAIVGLAGSNPLESGPGRGRYLPGGAGVPKTAVSPPATTRSPGPPTITWRPRRVAPGERVWVVGGGCYPIRHVRVSIDPLGTHESVPIDKDGSYSTLLTVPRTAKAGTYDLTVRCLIPSKASVALVVKDAVVVAESTT